MVDGHRAIRSGSSVAFLFRRGSIYSIAQASRMLAMLVVTPLVTRVLSSDQYGTLATATRVGQVIAVIVAMGVPGGLARMYFDRGGERTARRLATSTLLIAISAATVMHLTGPVWARMFDGLDYSGPLIVVVWMGVPLAALDASQAILRDMDDAAGFVIAAMIASAVAQLAGLVAVLAGGGPTAYLFWVAVVTAVAALFSATRAGVIGVRPADRSELAAALKLGGPTVPHLLALLVLAVGDRIVVERVIGLEEVARYEISYQVGALVLVVVAAVNQAWAPMIYAADDADRWDVLVTTTAAIEKTATPLIGALCFAAPVGIAILAPASYDLAGLGRVTAIVAGATILYIRYLANVHIVFQVKRTLVLAWSTPVAAVVNIVAAVVLTDHWGLVGCALATVIAYGILSLLTGLVARRHAHVDWDWTTMFTSSAVVAACVIGAAAMPEAGTTWAAIRLVLVLALGAWTLMVVRRSIERGTPSPAR